MEKFKEMYNRPRVAAFAKTIALHAPGFSAKAFLKDAWPALESLEMKDRVRLLARLLRKHLPERMETSLPILVAAVRSERNPEGLEGFAAWPLTQYVEDFGLSTPELALDALKELTKVMSAEFAVRPFLLQHEALTLARFRQWASHENAHVRRLVSEGTRPLLPWGQRLKRFQADPEICLPFLRQLRADPEIYVRRSVANHLNDIAKTHPDLLVRELARWQMECAGDQGVQWILRHASRTLVKAGHGGALGLHGYHPARWRQARLQLKPGQVKLGEALALEFSATADRSGKWVIDYAVHHRKKDGRLKPKVFKWAVRSVKAGERVALTKKHPIRRITTRVYYPGAQEVEVLVNGKSAGKKAFHLKVPAKGR